MELKGAAVLVTAGSRGIGRAIAEKLAVSGAPASPLPAATRQS
jgi:NAD(P)-dependent dehydrogenase (short-subunit alcohol dehydrogenase family)